MRRSTTIVNVGNVKVGGSNDITVQSMTKTDTRDAKKLSHKLKI